MLNIFPNFVLIFLVQNFSLFIVTLCKLSSAIYHIPGNIFKHDMYIFCLYNNDWFYLKLIFVSISYKINFCMTMGKLCEIITPSLTCSFLVGKLASTRKYKNIEERTCILDKNDSFFCIIMDTVDHG